MELLLDDFAIRKIALVASFAGLAAILILGETAGVEKVEAWQIDENMLGKEVSTTGIVKWARMSKGVLMLQIGAGQGVAAVVMNPDEREQAILAKGRNVEITGIVKKYNGAIEVEVSEVKTVN
ncbi:MAG: hypothetical protein V1676_01575 [Candidatus Diapherotrites archaeon]